MELFLPIKNQGVYFPQAADIFDQKKKKHSLSLFSSFWVPPSLYSFLCLFLSCVCMYVYVGAVFRHACGRQRSALGFIHQNPSLWFFRQGISLVLNLLISLGCLARKFQGSSTSLVLRFELCTTVSSSLIASYGSHTQVLKLTQHAPYQ